MENTGEGKAQKLTLRTHGTPEQARIYIFGYMLAIQGWGQREANIKIQLLGISGIHKDIYRKEVTFRNVKN